MDGEQLLATLRDDIEWPAATVRLLYNYLDPLEEAFQGQPERLGKVWELRQLIESHGGTNLAVFGSAHGMRQDPAAMWIF